MNASVKEILSQQARKAAQARWSKTPREQRTRAAKNGWRTRIKNILKSIETNEPKT